MSNASIINKPIDEVHTDITEEPLTPEEIEYARILEDPVLWCETHLKNPDNPSKFLEFRWYQREMIRYQPKRVWGEKDQKHIWTNRKKIYRCIDADSPVLMSNGRWKRISDIKVGDSVVSRNRLNQVVTAPVSNVWNNGIQETYQITLDNGNSITLTDDHELLANIPTDDEYVTQNSGYGGVPTKRRVFRNMWATIQHGLSVGVKVRTLRSYTIFGPTKSLDDAKFLGYMLTDGYFGQTGQTPKFTGNNISYMQEVREIANRKFGYVCTLKKRDGSNAYDCWITDGKKGSSNLCLDWFRSINLFGIKRLGKRIPNILFDWDKETTATFINRLFAGDGCASIWRSENRPNSGQLSLTSSNRPLLEEVRRILLKFDIQSRIRSEWRPSPSYPERIGLTHTLLISDGASIKLFFKEIGYIYGKEEQCALLEDAIKRRRYTYRRSRGDLAYRWSTIRKIERIGPRNVWDIEVANHHNFICDGIVTHNCGRRIGKTIALLAECLWLAYTNKNYKVLLLCPYEEQMRGAWMLLKSLIQDSLMPTRVVEKPFIIEFSNGSIIHGFVGGAKQVDSGGRGSPMRSYGADAIGVMEMDHGIDHVLRPALIPIFNGKAHCRWIGDSTPSGRRGLFYEWCTTPENKGGAKEFHFPSRISPEWNEELEKSSRRDAGSDAIYEHEYEAEFGELAQGVFKSEDIDEIMSSYIYDIGDIAITKEYSMGVDWNQVFGVKIYVIEHNKKRGTFRTFFKHEVPNNEYTQTQAVDRIIEISKKIPLSYIYVDKGFGTTQVELLHKYGKEHPESRLQKIVKSIDFKGTVEIRDPWTKKIVKKPLKPFCVANAARIVENRAISIPEEENHKNGLIGQMRGYNMLETPSGNIVFQAENRDDLLIAWMLGLLPYATESGEFSHYEAVNTIGRIHDPLKLEDKFQRNDREVVQKTRNILSSINTGGMSIKVRRFKPVVAGSTMVPIGKKDAPPGSIQFPLRRDPRRTRTGGPKRTTF